MLGTEARGGDESRNSKNKPTEAPLFGFSLFTLKDEFCSPSWLQSRKKTESPWIFFSLPKHFSVEITSGHKH